MGKKVYFYTVELYETANGMSRDYKNIKELIIDIIEKNAEELDGFWALDLTRDNDLHYVADIFAYSEECLVMRVSSQKPSGSYLYRDYTTNVPAGVLDGVNEEKEGIEVYTYALLEYETGIFSIINQQSAPSHKIINYFLTKYTLNYYMDFVPIPNPDGISRIYGATEPRISQVEIEVPIPSAEALQQMFHWDRTDILNIQGNGLKAVMRLSGVDKKIITETEAETRGLIECIRTKITDYTKAKVRAKAVGVRTQDYSFFDENFSYPIEIPTYRIVNGKKYYLSADELIPVYCDNLQMAYNENRELLRIISDR